MLARLSTCNSTRDSCLRQLGTLRRPETILWRLGDAPPTPRTFTQHSRCRQRRPDRRIGRRLVVDPSDPSPVHHPRSTVAAEAAYKVVMFQLIGCLREAQGRQKRGTSVVRANSWSPSPRASRRTTTPAVSGQGPAELSRLVSLEWEGSISIPTRRMFPGNASPLSGGLGGTLHPRGERNTDGGQWVRPS